MYNLPDQAIKIFWKNFFIFINIKNRRIYSMGNCNNMSYIINNQNNQEKMQKLVVITPYYSFQQNQKQAEVFKKFMKKMSKIPNIDHYTIQCHISSQDQLFQGLDSQKSFHVIATDKINLKQNLINIILEKIPSNTKYIACIDYNITFLNEKWVQNALMQLKIFDCVQLFSDFQVLNVDQKVIFQSKGKFYKLCQYYKKKQHIKAKSMPALKYLENFTQNKFNKKQNTLGHAWAFTDAYRQQIFKLFDLNLLGNGADYIYDSIIQRKWSFFDKLQQNHPYRKKLDDWALNSIPVKGYGYVQGKIKVFPIENEYNLKDYEEYVEKNQFDPKNQIRYNSKGVIVLQQGVLKQKIYSLMNRREQKNREMEKVSENVQSHINTKELRQLVNEYNYERKKKQQQETSKRRQRELKTQHRILIRLQNDKKEEIKRKTNKLQKYKNQGQKQNKIQNL